MCDDGDLYSVDAEYGSRNNPHYLSTADYAFKAGDYSNFFITCIIFNYPCTLNIVCYN